MKDFIKNHCILSEVILFVLLCGIEALLYFFAPTVILVVSGLFIFACCLVAINYIIESDTMERLKLRPLWIAFVILTFIVFYATCSDIDNKSALHNAESAQQYGYYTGYDEGFIKGWIEAGGDPDVDFYDEGYIYGEEYTEQFYKEYNYEYEE